MNATVKLRKAIDDLVDFYEKHKPQAGQEIDVELTASELAKVLNVVPARGQVQFPYRGRTLVAKI